jgi:hypothetical protein
MINLESGSGASDVEEFPAQCASRLTSGWDPYEVWQTHVYCRSLDASDSYSNTPRGTPRALRWRRARSGPAGRRIGSLKATLLRLCGWTVMARLRRSAGRNTLQKDSAELVSGK